MGGRLQPNERGAAATIGERDATFPLSVLGKERVVSNTLGGQELVVFFKPGTRFALEDLLIGNSDEIGVAWMFAPTWTGESLPSGRKATLSFIDSETDGV